MKILFLTTHFNTGGITSYLLTLTKGLVEQGHEVIVMSNGGDCEEALNRLNARHQRIPFRTKSIADPRIYFFLKEAARFIREEKVDILHAHTRVTQVMGFFLSRMTQRPLCSTCHGFFRPNFFRKVFPCWGKAAIAISGPVSDHLMKDLKVDPKTVHLIPNGVDLNEFKILDEKARADLRRQWNFNQEPLIGMIARLSDVKGHQFLIEAMRRVVQRYPSAKLLIFGQGPHEDYLRQLVESKGLLDQVYFYKVVNQTARILPMFDLFVMPSLQEGLGLSVMEAQAAAVPVIASKVGGLVDLIEDRVTGMLVPPANADHLTEAILFLLDNKPLAQRLGKSGRLFIEQNFSAQKMIQKTVHVYEQLKNL